MRPRPPASKQKLPAEQEPTQTSDNEIPLEEGAGEAIPPTGPPVETALDDDEGGATPIDQETGRPYAETDPGTEMPLAERQGGTKDS